MCPRAYGHVRASVSHYNFVMLTCTIFILTIIVQFGMDIQYIMGKYGIVFYNFTQACKCCNIKDFLCQFKK